MKASPAHPTTHRPGRRTLPTAIIAIAGLLGSLLASVATLATIATLAQPATAQAQATTFAPRITFAEIPGGTTDNPHAGQTFTFGFVGTGSERSDPATLPANPIGCSTGITLITYTIQDDATVDSDGTQLVESPAGTSDTCSYDIVHGLGAEASSNRLLGLTSSGDAYVDPSTGDNPHIYTASTTFTPTVAINGLNSSYENVKFMVTYSYASGGNSDAGRGERTCSKTTHVIYKINSSGTAALDTGQTAAALVHVPAAEGGSEACVYNVSVDLIDSRTKRMARAASASPASTVQQSDLDIVDIWEEDTNQPQVRQPPWANTIPGGTSNNPYAGETITYVLDSDHTGSSDPNLSRHTQPTGCSPDGTRLIYVVQPDGSLLLSAVEYPNPDPTNTANPVLTSSLTVVRLPAGETGFCLYDLGTKPQASSGRALALRDSTRVGMYLNANLDSTLSDVYEASSFFEPVIDISVPTDSTFAGVEFDVTFTRRTGGSASRCSAATTVTYAVHPNGGKAVFSPRAGETQTIPRLVNVPAGRDGPNVFDACQYRVAIELADAANASRIERDSSVTLSDVRLQESSPTVTDTWVATASSGNGDGNGNGNGNGQAPASVPEGSFAPDIQISVPASDSAASPATDYANIEFAVSYTKATTPAQHADCSSDTTVTYISDANGNVGLKTGETAAVLVDLPPTGTEGTDNCVYDVTITKTDPSSASATERAGAIPSTVSAASPRVIDLWHAQLTSTDLSYTPPACSEANNFRPHYVLVLPFVDRGDGTNVFHNTSTFAWGDVDDALESFEGAARFLVEWRGSGDSTHGSVTITTHRTNRVLKIHAGRCVPSNRNWIARAPAIARLITGDHRGAELTVAPGSMSERTVTSGDSLLVTRYQTTYKIPYVAADAGPAPMPMPDTSRTPFMPRMLFDNVDARFAGETITFTYTAGSDTDPSIVTPDGTLSKCSAPATEIFEVRSDGSITTQGIQTLTDSPEGTTLRCSYIINAAEVSSNRWLARTSQPGQSTTGNSPDPGGGNDRYTYEASSTFDTDVNISVPDATYSGVGFTVTFTYASGGIVGVVTDGAPRCSATTTVMYEVNSSGDVVPAGSASEATLINVPADQGSTPRSSCVYSVTIELTTSTDSSRLERDSSVTLGNVQGSATPVVGTDTVVVTDRWVAPGSSAPDTSHRTFRPQITIPNVDPKFSGNSFSIPYTVADATPASIKPGTSAPTTCSGGLTPPIQRFTVQSDGRVTSGPAPDLTGSPEGTAELCTYDVNVPSAWPTGTAAGSRLLALASPDDQTVTIDSRSASFTYEESTTFMPSVNISVPDASYSGIGFRVWYSRTSGGGDELKCSADLFQHYEVDSNGDVDLDSGETEATLIDTPAGPTSGNFETPCVYSVVVSLLDSNEMRLMRDPAAGDLVVQQSDDTVSDSWVAAATGPPAPGDTSDPDPAPVPAGSFRPDIQISVPASDSAASPATNYADIEFAVSYTKATTTPAQHADCSADTTVTYISDANGNVGLKTGETAAALIDLPAAGTAGTDNCVYEVTITKTDPSGASTTERAGATPSTVSNADAIARSVIDLWRAPPNLSFTPNACPNANNFRPHFVLVIPFVDRGDGTNVFHTTSPLNWAVVANSGLESFGGSARFLVEWIGSGDGTDGTISINPRATDRVIKVQAATCVPSNRTWTARVPTSAVRSGGDHSGATLTLSDDSMASKTITSGDSLLSVRYETTYKASAVQQVEPPTPLSHFQPTPSFANVPARHAGATFTFTYSVAPSTDDEIETPDGTDMKCSAEATEIFTVQLDGTVTSNGAPRLIDSPEGTHLRCTYSVNRADASSTRLLGLTSSGGQLVSGRSPNPGTDFRYSESRLFTPTVSISVPGASFAGVGFTVEFSRVGGGGDQGARKCSLDTTVTYVVNSSGDVVPDPATSQTAAMLVDVPADSSSLPRCDYSVSVTLTNSANTACIRRDASADPPGNVRSGDRATVSDTWVAVPGGTCVAGGGGAGGGTTPTRPATNFEVTIDATVPTTGFAGTTLRFGFNAAASGLSNPQGCSRNVTVTLTVAANGSVPQGTASLIDTPTNSARSCTYQVVFPQAPANGRLGYVAGPSDVVRVSAAATAASYTFSEATTFDPDITITAPAGFADSEFTVRFDPVSGSHRGCPTGLSETHVADAAGAVAVSTTGGRTEATLVDIPAGGAASDSCSYVVVFPVTDSSGQLGLPAGAARATVSAASAAATQAYEPATTFEPSVSVVIPEADTDRDGTHDFSGQTITVSYSPRPGSDSRCAVTGDSPATALDTFAATDDPAGVVERTTAPNARPVLIDQPAGSSVSCIYNVNASATIESTIAGSPALRLTSTSARATVSAGRPATLGYAFPAPRTRVDPLPLIRAADSVGNLPINVSLTVPAAAGRIFGSDDVFEVNVSVPGQCGIDTRLFGGVQATDGVAYGVPATQTGRSQLIGSAPGAAPGSSSGTLQTNPRAAYTLPEYVQSAGQQIPCEVRVTQLTAPVGCTMRNASQDLLDRLFISAVWSPGATAYDISVSYDCQPQQGWLTLEQGWMILPFNGDSGTLPAAFARNLDNAVSSVWVWHAPTQSWRGWSADGTARGLSRLNRGDNLMVYAPAAATVSFSPPSLLDTPAAAGNLTLPPLYSMQVFGGTSRVALFDLFGFQPGSVAVLFRWDAANQNWHYHLPGRNPIDSLDIPWFDVIGPRDAVFMYNVTGTQVTILWS